MEYTDAQRAAIGTLDEPLLIVACAGSGKTQVISRADRGDPAAARGRTEGHRRVHVHREGGRGAEGTGHRADHGRVSGDDRAGGAVHRDHARIRPRPAPDLGAGGVQAERALRRAGPAVHRPQQQGQRAHRRRRGGERGTEEAQAVRELAALHAGARHPPRGRRQRGAAAGLAVRRAARLPEAAPGQELLRLHRAAPAHRRPARLRRRRRHGRGADPARPRSRPVCRGGRVPGHEPDPGEADPAAVPVRGEPVRGRRRRPDDLPVARQRGVQHLVVHRPARGRAQGHAGRQLPLLAGDRRARPGGRRAQRPGPAGQEHGRRRAPDLRTRRHAGADLRLRGRRGGVDLRPDRAAARRPVHGLPGGAAARAVLVGLRGAVPLGVQGRGRACRRAAAPVDPVRDQGA